MATINLLTIHWGESYGGTMQTYATLKTLRSLGHTVTLINLIHPKTKFRNKYTGFKSLYNLVKKFQFYLFRKRYFGHMTKPMNCIVNNRIPKCDYTIVGSDQVWNEQITTELKQHYFLDFVSSGGRIAYASSFGKDSWTEDSDYTHRVKSLLSSFKAVSVREESGVRICNRVFNIDALQVLDPTLMHSDYDCLVHRSKPINAVYAFLLVHTKSSQDICDFTCKELNLPILTTNRFENVFRGGVKDWLNRMKNSAFIITDSFHGLAFSILFHKKFLVLCANEQKFTRLQSLLSLLGLENRFVNDLNDLLRHVSIIHEDIDYSKVDSILAFEREKTMAFLKQSVDE